MFDLVGSDWINVLQSSFTSQRSKLEQSMVGKRFLHLVGKQKKLVNHQIKQLQSSPELVKSRDKAAFVVGVTNLWVTALLVGVWPEVIPFFYVAKALVLLLMRLVVYRRKRWHYFMFDMCYFVNLLLIIFLAIPTSHKNLYAATWGLANGPVLMAITAWRNSLVFHSLDKVTSLLIHFDPPLTLFILRWKASPPGPSSFPQILPDHLLTLGTDPPALTLSHLMLVSVTTYIFWQAAYWVFVWTLKADKIQAGYATSTTWMLANTRSAISRLVSRVAKPYQPFMFMLIQLVYTIVTILPTYILYYNMYVHAAALIATMCVATWNGASYYFEVFSMRYVQELKGLRKELDRVESTALLGEIPSSAGDGENGSGQHEDGSRVTNADKASDNGT
ncbi:hypothetical protein DFS34DRAFT_582922 [Phlyctochytrium arcticum]|nr:hypothetical protein DFS34DRAFT_582922 [Phlyctochytrium arcticum]